MNVHAHAIARTSPVRRRLLDAARLGASTTALALAASLTPITSARSSAPHAPTLAANPATPLPEPPAVALPSSPQGECVAAYFKLMSAPTPDAARNFETRFASKSRLSRSSIDERASRAGELGKEWGRLTPEKIIESTPASISVLVRSELAGPMVFAFAFDAADQAKLDSITIQSDDAAKDSKPITADARKQLVDGAAKALREGYVFPKVGDAMAASIETKLAAGDYDTVADEFSMARRLTDDLRAISKDKHLGVMFAPQSSGEDRPRMIPSGDQLRRENYMFRKAEYLPGNIGYLRFDLFMEEDGAREAATAAIAFLANCDALIIDLRNNGGGSPDMIRYITTYLVDTRTHLNDMVDRDGNIVEEYWTLDSVPGKRLSPDLPVFVLTSPRTFSGAEEFSYNLKNLKRATIVGETTGGGAHPVRGERLSDRFVIRVPFMRACNPITKTNWEGTGVEPDVKVPASEALEKAQALAKDAIEHRAAK
ncbi:MAG: S41 family peptidase [Phycisphaerae bacterium]|nr:S41 family peptidase [Phycisphaerae bacterium]